MTSTAIKPGLEERRKNYEDRTILYRNAGFDRREAARFVAGSAGKLAGPVLEVGTGKGVLAIAIASRGLDVVSVDIDDGEQALACLLAREAGVAERIRFIRCDASSIPFPDGHFGCVAMMEVLHHLEYPERVFIGMVRVIRPGGIIIVADFDENGFDMVARVHEKEGRDHPRFPATVDVAVEKLLGIGLRCLARTNACFHNVAVMRKDVG